MECVTTKHVCMAMLVEGEKWIYFVTKGAGIKRIQVKLHAFYDRPTIHVSLNWFNKRGCFPPPLFILQDGFFSFVLHLYHIQSANIAGWSNIVCAICTHLIFLLLVQAFFLHWIDKLSRATSMWIGDKWKKEANNFLITISTMSWLLKSHFHSIYVIFKTMPFDPLLIDLLTRFDLKWIMQRWLFVCQFLIIFLCSCFILFTLIFISVTI